MTWLKRYPVWILTFLLVLPVLAEPAQQDCTAGFLPPRLQVGEPARVIPGGVPNRLRDQPSTSGAQVGMVAPESEIEILDGPVCDSEAGIIWWQVRFGNLTGWTAEGLPPDEYFLEPVSESGIAYGETAIAQSTLSSVETANAAAPAVIVDATSTEQARLATATILPFLTMTAQALITPSATFTPSQTPTITPTPAPLTPLPENREVITPENVDQLTTLASLPYGMGSVFFLPDHSQMLVNGSNCYDLPSMEGADQFGNYPLALGPVVAMSPDRRYIGYHSSPQIISIFDTQTEQSLELPDQLGWGWSDVAISGGPAYYLALAIGEGYASPEPPILQVYDLTARTLAFTLDNPAAFTAQVDFNRDGSRLATTGNDIRLISPRDRRWIIPTPGGSIGGLAYRPVADNEPEQIAFGGGPGAVLFDLGRGTSRAFTITGAVIAGSIGFSPDGRLMATVGTGVHGAFDATPPRFNLFDVETGDLLMDTDEYDGAFAFSPDGTLLVVSGGGITRILGVGA